MDLDAFTLAAAVVGVVAGATASVVGFGIGSLLTPLLALRMGTEIAVAVVAIPHAAATILRGWRLRHALDPELIVKFGVVSAAGALAGALLYSRLSSDALTRTLGALLVLTAVSSVTRWTERWHARGAMVWLLGALSGLFGGVVGNQGGLRAAALSAFDLRPAVFVATSTVTGILVDAARTPVYVWRAGDAMATRWEWIAMLAGATVVGTLLGERVLLGLSRHVFAGIVSVAVGLVGCVLLIGGA